MSRRERIDEAAHRIEAVLTELELHGDDEAPAIVRFALYRVVHRRLVVGGYTAMVRWSQPPFPEESDRESAP